MDDDQYEHRDAASVVGSLGTIEPDRRMKGRELLALAQPHLQAGTGRPLKSTLNSNIIYELDREFAGSTGEAASHHTLSRPAKQAALFRKETAQAGTVAPLEAYPKAQASNLRHESQLTSDRNTHRGPTKQRQYNEQMLVNDTDSDGTEMTRQVERREQRRAEGGGGGPLPASKPYRPAAGTLKPRGEDLPPEDPENTKIQYEDLEDLDTPYLFDEPNLNAELRQLNYVRQGGAGRAGRNNAAAATR